LELDPLSDTCSEFDTRDVVEGLGLTDADPDDESEE
jgi:hypothetical protein